jgi:hypothetical protein
MYKCGWNGCEKAYGTLNHLNAHVTMQSHGAKRTPEGMFFDIPVVSETCRVVLPALVSLGWHLSRGTGSPFGDGS